MKMKAKNPAICDQFFWTHTNPCYYCPLRDECQDDLQTAKLSRNRKRMRTMQENQKEEYYEENG